MSAHIIHLQDKRTKMSLNYLYIVFGGNPCGLKNVFDSSIVNEPSGFEPLKFYCIWIPLLIRCNVSGPLHQGYVWFSCLSTGARFDDGAGGDNEVQRTMLELINQLDGFDPRGNIKVLMATNRPDTLDPALMRPGRLDRKIEFGLPDLEVSLR